MAAPVADITWTPLGQSGIVATNGSKLPVHLYDGTVVVVKIKPGMTASGVVAAVRRAVRAVGPCPRVEGAPSRFVCTPPCS